MAPNDDNQRKISIKLHHKNKLLDELMEENICLRARLNENEHSIEQSKKLLIEADVEQRRLEIELSRSHNDLHLIITSIPQLVWRSHDDGQWASGSPQWQAYTGQSDPQSVGRGWLATVHPDDRSHTMQAWSAARTKGELVVEHRLRRESDGAYLWFQTRAVPRRETPGAIQEWFGISTEVHELKTLQERQSILLAELQHQTRKTLAGIRSLVRRSAEPYGSLTDYAAHLDGRLNAFARVVSAVARDPSRGIALGGLVADELLACLGTEDERVQVAGPRLLLQPKAAELLGLSLHELTTNALKYGALTTRRGRVHIYWQVEVIDKEAKLVFTWQECHLTHLITLPLHRGFGTAIIESVLPRELQAETSINFARGGIICRICLPFLWIISVSKSDD